MRQGHNLIVIGAFLFTVPLGVSSAHAATPSCFGHDATIVGAPGEAEVRGTPSDDVIVGSEGNFRIRGLAGNDLVCQGDALGSVLYGGRGGDKLRDGEFAAYQGALHGGRGSDFLLSRFEISLLGGEGDDRIKGLGRLFGGLGRDVLIGRDLPQADSQRFVGGLGRDTLNSLNGTAVADYSDAKKSVRVDLGEGVAWGRGRDSLLGIEGVLGSRFDDVLIGSDDQSARGLTLANSNELIGNRGNDVIHGRGGSDRVAGGRGQDVLFGGRGDDDIDGVDSNVFVSKNDLLRGGRGDDWLSGSDYSDDTLFGGPGNDRLSGFYGNNVLRGGSGDDMVRAGGRDESVRGGKGTDTIDFLIFGPITADLGKGIATGGSTDVELHGIENLFGSYFGDTLIGDNRRNVLYDGGNYSANSQKDLILGKGGRDRIYLISDPNDEAKRESFEVHGGHDRDTTLFATATNAVVANLRTGSVWLGSSVGTLNSVESLVGSPYADSLSGDRGSNSLRGLKGDDVLRGFAGKDDLDGGRGQDSLEGGAGTDTCINGEETTKCE